MSRNISVTVFSNLTVAAGGSSFVDMYLDDVSNMQILLDITYSGGSSTGLIVRMKGGFGKEDKTLTTEYPFRLATDGVYQAYPDTKTGGANITAAHNYEEVDHTIIDQGGAVNRKGNFYLNDIGLKWPRWVRMELINRDQSKSATVTCKADL